MMRVFSLPVVNNKFRMSFLMYMYEPVHFFKNIPNNWISEKTQMLKCFEPGTIREIRANWKDLISVYKEESRNILQLTKSDHQTLYYGLIISRSKRYVW